MKLRVKANLKKAESWEDRINRRKTEIEAQLPDDFKGAAIFEGDACEIDAIYQIATDDWGSEVLRLGPFVLAVKPTPSMPISQMVNVIDGDYFLNPDSPYSETCNIHNVSPINP